MVGDSALDVVCGTGYLLHVLSSRRPEMKLSGVDVIIDDETRKRAAAIGFHEANIESLPLDDGALDTVICTHVLEHILDVQGVLAGDRRVAGRRGNIGEADRREERLHIKQEKNTG